MHHVMIVRTCPEGRKSEVEPPTGTIERVTPCPNSHLTANDRHTICHLRLLGLSCRTIARQLSRDPSTISRELLRNGLPIRNGRGCAERPARLLGLRAKLSLYLSGRIGQGADPNGNRV